MGVAEVLLWCWLPLLWRVLSPECRPRRAAELCAWTAAGMGVVLVLLGDFDPAPLWLLGELGLVLPAAVALAAGPLRRALVTTALFVAVDVLGSGLWRPGGAAQSLGAPLAGVFPEATDALGTPGLVLGMFALQAGAAAGGLLGVRGAAAGLATAGVGLLLLAAPWHHVLSDDRGLRVAVVGGLGPGEVPPLDDVTADVVVVPRPALPRGVTESSVTAPVVVHASTDGEPVVLDGGEALPSRRSHRVGDATLDLFATQVGWLATLSGSGEHRRGGEPDQRSKRAPAALAPARDARGDRGGAPPSVVPHPVNPPREWSSAVPPGHLAVKRGYPKPEEPPMNASDTPRWETVFPLTELPSGGVRTVKRGAQQVAVFRVSEGELFAIDNRCPHEGYPLAQGARQGCTLTCCWHNWKFDLRDGACTKGGEAVRTFPVRVTAGHVELDLSPLDSALAISKHQASLDEALVRGRQGQAIRDATRLLSTGVPAARLASIVAAFDGARAEWGVNHTVAVAADLLRWQDRYPGPSFAIPLAQGIDLAIRGCQRRPIRALATPEDPGADSAAAGAELRRRVEAEDGPGAEAILRGALSRGWGRAELEPWFFPLCADHFLSFGHRLIYQIKVFDLLEEAGWDDAEAILCGHLYGIVCGTREDVLPAWRGFRTTVDALDLPELHARAGTNSDWDDGDTLLAALLDGTQRAALKALIGALEAGAPLEALVDVLSVAAAERMLRFDPDIDTRTDCQDNWLSVTHIQTYMNAVRSAVERYTEPGVLRMLLFGARFINHHRVLDLRPEARPPEALSQGELDDVLAAVGDADAPRAVGAARALLAAGGADALRDALMDLSITDAFSVPIVSAHVMKNTVAAFDEVASMGDPRPVLAVVRLLASPLRQRWTHRGALEAVAFVTQGKVPKLLAP